MVKISLLTHLSYAHGSASGLSLRVPARRLPVIVLEALVAEEQVSEAEAGRQWRYLALLLLHLESGDV